MREENGEQNCRECGESLFELKGELYCPACDSVSGFELVPDREQFTL